MSNPWAHFLTEYPRPPYAPQGANYLQPEQEGQSFRQEQLVGEPDHPWVPLLGSYPAPPMEDPALQPWARDPHMSRDISNGAHLSSWTPSLDAPPPPSPPGHAVPGLANPGLSMDVAPWELQYEPPAGSPPRSPHEPPIEPPPRAQHEQPQEQLPPRQYSPPPGPPPRQPRGRSRGRRSGRRDESV